MAQKNATPTKEQKDILERNGLKAMCWTVIQDFQHGMIVRNKLTGDVKMLNK